MKPVPPPSAAIALVTRLDALETCDSLPACLFVCPSAAETRRSTPQVADKNLPLVFAYSLPFHPFHLPFSTLVLL